MHIAPVAKHPLEAVEREADRCDELVLQVQATPS